MAQILAFGDSITDGFYDAEGGWASRMQRYFMANNAVDNRPIDEAHWFYNLGISGDTAAGLLSRIEVEARARKVERPGKEAVIVFGIGTNDSAAEGNSDDYCYTPEQFEANYRELLKFATKCTNKVMCLASLPVIEKYTNPIYGNIWYGNARISLFNRTIKELSKEYGAQFLDVYEVISKESKIEGYYIDGLHPNTAGHVWLYEQIKPKLLELLASK